MSKQASLSIHSKLPCFLLLTFLTHQAALVCFLVVRLFLCCLPDFAPTASRKKRAAKNYSPLWAQCETLGFIEDYAHKFHQEAMNWSKLSKRWLAQLYENPVDCICGWSLFVKQANFFSTVFSKQFSYQKETLKVIPLFCIAHPYCA